MLLKEILEVIVFNYSVSLTAIISTVVGIVFLIMRHRNEMKRFLKLLGLDVTKLNRKYVRKLKKYMRVANALLRSDLAHAIFELATKSKDTAKLAEFIKSIQNTIEIELKKYQI